MRAPTNAKSELTSGLPFGGCKPETPSQVEDGAVAGVCAESSFAVCAGGGGAVAAVSSSASIDEHSGLWTGNAAGVNLYLGAGRVSGPTPLEAEGAPRQDRGHLAR